ncbi:MAG: hypothetical protein JXC31_01100 [Acholeplasmataceae bacterium]|nr:hypothetical protein [Acholeplasmataceae bacterium]
MVKKILFVIVMLIATFFVIVSTMYKQTLQNIETVINQAIDTEDYSGILAYNDYYYDNPMYYLKNDDVIVSVHNSYDQDVQSLTFIIIDKNKINGDQSELKITCNEEFLYTDIFSSYEKGNISVITLTKNGIDDYSLNNECSIELFENVSIKLSDGTEVFSVSNQIGFINDTDIINTGTIGYSEDDLFHLQYPDGFIKPMILPILILWLSVMALVYIYIRLKNKKKEK